MPAGRPTLYDPAIHPPWAFRLSLLGLGDREMCRVMEVDEKTFNTWKKKHPEFLQSLREGKDDADAKVAASLYQRAMGYSHPAVKIVADAKTGAVVEVPYTEHYPPDTGAAIIWLKNRKGDLWRDRQHVVVEDPDKVLARVLGVEPEALPEPEAVRETEDTQVVNEAANDPDHPPRSG